MDSQTHFHSKNVYHSSSSEYAAVNKVHNLRCNTVLTNLISYFCLNLTADPFAYVSFISRSQKSEVIKHTLCPNWDQTMIFDEIEIQGDPNVLAANPPDVCIEVMDFDTFVSIITR